METLTLASLDLTIACRVLEGEEVSGDRHLVRATRDGILIAVIDGLGHGAAAAESAARTAARLERDADAPLNVLLMRCHEDLNSTRGVAIGLASVRPSDGRLTWLGVGNVGGLLFRPADAFAGRPIALRSLPGIVGARIPLSLPVWETELRTGDVLVITTDGIRPEFEDELDVLYSSHHLAQAIVDRHARDADDALVVVARYGGREG